MIYQPLPIGIDDFEKLIANGYYYVDKTLLIKDLLDRKGEVNLFTRPRRFGKTLNLSMLKYYFEDTGMQRGMRRLRRCFAALPSQMPGNVCPGDGEIPGHHADLEVRKAE